MVAALAPSDFRSGARDCGTALPHARLTIAPDGTLRISGESVCRGYFPGAGSGREFATDDLARFDERGGLEILGRRDALIITGGKKVDPLEVEAALRASGEFADVAVVGVPDPDWGQAVVACYPAAGRPPNLSKGAAELRKLASFKHPRRYAAVSDWPRNAQGKINRAALAQMAAAAKA